MNVGTCTDGASPSLEMRLVSVQLVYVWEHLSPWSRCSSFIHFPVHISAMYLTEVGVVKGIGGALGHVAWNAKRTVRETGVVIGIGTETTIAPVATTAAAVGTGTTGVEG